MCINTFVVKALNKVKPGGAAMLPSIWIDMSGSSHLFIRDNCPYPVDGVLCAFCPTTSLSPLVQ
jgi:hypothetical protein